MTSRLGFVRAAGVALALLLIAAPAMAAEGGGENWLGLPVPFWLWLNLFVFWGFILYFLVPPIRSFLERRRLEIHDSLVRAEEQRREAQELEGTLQGRIDELKREMDDLVRRAQEDGGRERASILAQAEAERKRVVKQTEDEIGLRIAQAREELTSYAAKLSSDLARQRLSSQLTAQQRRRLFDEGLQRLTEEKPS